MTEDSKALEKLLHDNYDSHPGSIAQVILVSEWLLEHDVVVRAEYVAETHREAMAAIDKAHLSQDRVALVEATMQYWWSQAESMRRERDAAMLAPVSSAGEAQPTMAGRLRALASEYEEQAKGIRETSGARIRRAAFNTVADDLRRRAKTLDEVSP